MHTVRLNGVDLRVPDPGDPGYGEPAKRGSPYASGVDGQLELRVSEKRALSVYGMRRFPITLYADEWERVFEEAERLRAFIAEHPELSRK